MLRLADLPHAEVVRRLAQEGLRWRLGPALYHLHSDVAAIGVWLQTLYADAPVMEAGQGVTGCHAALLREPGLRRWFRPQVRLWVDGPTPFLPFPLDHAPPHLEWGLNFLFTTRHAHKLLLHAGVVERHGRALILPGFPGYGKSTLTAALSLRGWRLFSDEFGLFEPGQGLAKPMPKAIALKNEAIEVIRAWAPQAPLGPLFPKTRKGTVCHLYPAREAVQRMDEGAVARWIVFPRYQAGVPLQLYPLTPEQLFPRLAGGAFNYETLGEAAFTTVAQLCQSCTAFEMPYSQLSEAVQVLTQMADEGIA
ncbi:Hpr(Ser) kinase/phosphatase [Magnetococcus marinus MC-1]|uniref:Hpr(Ser) kinase/phosphatase n=1 Tax=Magnetococcus marinus (strain ATCC BAA-1437 / JCM 17883 / MC-1) TaxID=156889 RepID=A0L572_MAGMM|nr:HprK-related kinase A [Magnetococcus marinus]ABK43115.1 Hpr(Ser) kinase/phosphatase [Magnetococcus marinus MC-1]